MTEFTLRSYACRPPYDLNSFSNCFLGFQVSVGIRIRHLATNSVAHYYSHDVLKRAGILLQLLDIASVSIDEILEDYYTFLMGLRLDNTLVSPVQRSDQQQAATPSGQRDETPTDSAPNSWVHLSL